MKAFYCSTFLLAAIFFSTVLTKESDPCRYSVDNKYINDPSSCKAYFKCMDGKAIPGNCPNDYWFDILTGSCGYQSDIDCEDGGVEEDPCKDKCDGKNPCFVNNPASCAAYFFCQNGEAVAAECENGQHFHPVHNKCVYPTESTCIDSATGGTTKDNVCRNKANNQLVRNPQDCAKYHICINQKAAADFDCLPDGYFDLRSGSCVKKGEVDCDIEHVEPTCPDDTEQFINDPNSCSGYYHCKDKKIMSHGKCPEDQWLFNGVCEWSLKVPDTTCANRCDGKKGKGFVLKPGTDCKSYYHCVNGKPNGDKQDCEDKTIFDVIHEVCVAEGGTYKCPIK